MESKGVNVDFDESERTTILNYSGKNGWNVSKVEASDYTVIGGWDVSKLKKDDLNSSILMDVWDVKDNPEIRIINFNSAKLLNMQEISFVNESKFILSDDAKMSIEGRIFYINDLANGLPKDIELIEYRDGDSKFN